MSSDVTPVKECQICFELYDIKCISDLKCWAENRDDHAICYDCFNRETENRKQKGLQYPNECIICKPYQERIETIVINPTNTITITIDNNQQTPDICHQISEYYKRIFISILLFMVMYISLIINWHFYRILAHLLETGEFLDTEIDWHVFNALYALLLDAVIFLLVISIIAPKR